MSRGAFIGGFYAGRAEDVISPPHLEEGWREAPGWSGFADEANIGDPVARSARETRFNIFTLEVGGGPAKPRWVDIFKHVDVDDRVEMVCDLTGDQRHGTAPRADMKRGSPGSEGVLRHERGITNSDRQPGIGVRSPDTSVLDAEGTTARARRNLGRVSFPFELEGDIAAVAFTIDEHVEIGASRVPRALACSGSARCPNSVRRSPVRSI